VADQPDLDFPTPTSLTAGVGRTQKTHAIGRFSDELEETLRGRVKMRGYVDDIASEYAQASLLIAPILSGGGTQIKIIDALAHGRPLVASRFAQAGFAGDFRDLEHLLACTSVDDWVKACTHALTNRQQFEEMA
jgi:glycosyltransferase involved in cell wall biosynthesis